MSELDDNGYSKMVFVVGRKKIVQQNFLKDGNWVFLMDVTHWMPIPELPED